MRQQHSSGSRLGAALVTLLVVTLFSNGSYLLAADQKDGLGPVGVKGFSLKHISAQQAKQFLAELKLGTVSQLPGTNMLLLTARPAEIAKAAVLLDVVDADAKEQFVVKAICPASQAKDLPPKERIAAAIGNVSLGDFSNPPDPNAVARAIIDVHNDSVLAIAPASLAEKIVLTIEKLQKPVTEQTLPPAPEPNKPSTPDAENGLAQIMQKLLADTGAEVKPDANGAPVRAEPNEPKPQPEPELKPETQMSASPKIEQKAAQIKRPSGVVEPNAAIVSLYKPGPVPNGDETLRLDLPDNVDIILLLGLAGQYLGLDFMYDPNEVKGAVTLKLQGTLKGPIKVKELYPLLESALNFRGFVMTRKGNLVTIVPKDKALEIDPSLLADADKAVPVQYGDVVITRVFALKHVDTTSAANLLKGMKLGTDVSPIPGAKKLIVTEYAYRMPRVDRLIEMIDKPGEPKKFTFRQLQYTMAKTLAQKVKTLAEQLGTVSITIPELAAEEYTPSPRAPNETDQAYNLRIAREKALWAARRAQAQSPTQPGAARAPQPEPVSPTVYLDADERTNRILMIGLQDQLKEVEELISALDVQQQDLRTLQLYRIEHVGAEEVKNKLAELGIISPSQTAASQRITTRATKSAPVTPAVPAQPLMTPTTTAETKEALIEEPQVVVMEQTNSLLVNATAEQHARINTIISYVDSKAEATSIPYVVYPLENQDPNQLQAVLEKLIMETTTKEDKEAKIVTTEKTTRRKEEEIVIVADPKTYSLIVYANKENQQWISNLVKQLDEYRPQVLLDVTLVEVTKMDEFNYDLDVISSFPDLTETSGLTDVITDLSQAKRDRFIDLESKSGAGTGFYGDRHINVLLDAIQKKNYGRILARPKLLVNDNEPGKIDATESTYISRKETSYIPGAQQGSSIPVDKEIFEKYDAGITLDIEPHISKGDQLRLTITMSRTDFRMGAVTTGKPPDQVKSEVTTVVTVPNGTTIILGGLERLKQSKGGTKVPLIGDIPLIGGLFRSAANTDEQSRLYVFVKAHILRPGEEPSAKSDIEIVSRKNRDRFEAYEEEMQKYEDWPGIKPKSMDPAKVLESE